MALVIADRVLETCTAPGTGTVSLLGAVTGYRTFIAAIGNANTCYYTISDQNGANWEVGIGTVTSGSPNTLARNTILASSNSGAIVNFSSGTQNVFETYPAERSVYLDASSNVSALGTITSATWQATTVGIAYGGTGSTSYTAPAAGVNPLVWYNGTALVTDSTVTDAGYNSSTHTLYSNNLTASGNVTFTSTGAMLLPAGTTAQQPSPATAGMLRFNTDTSQFEGYNGSAWSSVGGAAISNDTTTSTNEYPLFASATSGTALTVYTSNAKLLYKPSTGEFQSTVLNASNGIVVNNATIGTSYTIPTGSNAMSAGPVTVSSGITVTVPSGSRWVVL